MFDFDFRLAIVADVEVMKFIRFSFKSEPIWMIVFTLVPAVVGLLILLLALLLRMVKLSVSPVFIVFVLLRGSFAWPEIKNDPRNHTKGHERKPMPQKENYKSAIKNLKSKIKNSPNVYRHH